MGRRCHPRPRNIFSRTGRNPTCPGVASAKTPPGTRAPPESPQKTAPITPSPSPGLPLPVRKARWVDMVVR